MATQAEIETAARLGITVEQVRAQPTSGFSNWGDYIASLRKTQSDEFVPTPNRPYVYQVWSIKGGLADQNKPEFTFEHAIEPPQGYDSWQQYNQTLEEKRKQGLVPKVLYLYAESHGGTPISETSLSKSARAKVESATPPSPREEMEWRQEARQSGLMDDGDITAYVKQRWFSERGVTPSELAQAGKVMPGAEVESEEQAVKLNKAFEISQKRFEAQQKEFERRNIVIDGQSMSIDDWNKLPETYQSIALQQGFDIMSKTAKADTEIFESNHIKLAGSDWIAKKDWDSLSSKYQTIGEKQGFDAMSKAIETDQKLPPAKIAKEIALDMVPVYGTYRYYQRAKEGGWTPSEIAWMSASVVSDLLLLVPLVSGAAAGARAATGVGRTARLVGAAKGIGKFAIAEVKSPYTMIRHPVATAKGSVQPLKTILFPKHVPLAAAEVTTTTVRIPVKSIGEAKVAMTLRDAATEAAMYGKSTAVEVAGREVQITPAIMSKLGEPIAIHATPDVTPFLTGATIKTSREGGLFVAPSLHTRFTIASAFGNLPEKGIKGALVIRDEAIIRALKPSGKIYRGSAEAEKIFAAGRTLPAPSQVLFTTNTAGDRLALLVLGKPFTPHQIAQLKFLGSLETIKQIFTPAVRVRQLGKLERQTKTLDNLLATESTLKIQANKLESAGKVSEAVKIERRLTGVSKDISRLRTSVDIQAARYAPLRFAVATTGLGTLERWARVTGESRVERANIVRLPEIVSPRLFAQERRPVIETRRLATVIPERLPERVESPRRTSEVIVRRGPVLETVRRTPEGVPSRELVRIPKTSIPRIPPPEKLPKGLGRISSYAGTSPSKVSSRLTTQVPITWRQGAFWWTVNPPYKTNDDVSVSRIPPEGAFEAQGLGSAYKTIQSLGGNADILLKLDMGIMDVIIAKPKRSGGAKTIRFKRDIRQKTRGDINLKLTTVRRG